MNKATSQAHREQSSVFAEAIVALQYSQEPEVWEKYGELGRQKSVRDAVYHLAYLGEAITFSSPDLFIDYINWVKVLFEGLKFTPDAIRNTLLATRSIVCKQLNPEMAGLIDEYIDAGLKCLLEKTQPIPNFGQDSLSQSNQARDYLDALLLGDRHSATQIILDAFANGVDVNNIYLNIFQPVQYEVGRLWHTSLISVAQEHFCSFVIQLNMSMLSPHFYNTKRVNRRMVAACIGSEVHELGMRMVTDFLEIGGWDTYYLGGNTPMDSILQSLVKQRADLLAISATLTIHVSQVADLIQKVRASEQTGHVKILVGGYPFKVDETLWQTIGADGYGRDAQQALEVANALVGITNPSYSKIV